MISSVTGAPSRTRTYCFQLRIFVIETIWVEGVGVGSEERISSVRYVIEALFEQSCVHARCRRIMHTNTM